MSNIGILPTMHAVSPQSETHYNPLSHTEERAGYLLGCDGMATALIYATNLITKSNIALAKYISKNAGTDIFNLKDLMRLNLDAYDTIIFGSSNINGKPDKLVQEFIETNKDVLSSKKKLLYVVCLKEHEKMDEQAKAIAEELGFSEVFIIHKWGEEKNESGFSSEVDAFIEKLR
jgi:hypothetical protein